MYRDCGYDNFEILEDSCSDLDIIENNNFWLADVSTGARILSNRDELSFFATTEQEMFLKLKFGDKIRELTDYSSVEQSGSSLGS